jgi:ABC-type multidrug transport system fused ATPase/permease subunit
LVRVSSENLIVRGEISPTLPDIAQATAAANRILAMRRKDDSGGQPLPRDSTDVEDDEKGGVRIEFSNVWFRYPTRDAPVLNGLNLTVRQSHYES